MGTLRRIVLSLALVAGLVPAISFAQAPPPVPALPDSPRLTSTTLVSSTCACNVGFALYGDSTDYQSWVEVYLNGVLVNYNDATFGWTITSPTGPLASIPRPVTDGVLTFTNAQTGTVQIVGARRPRRTSTFAENRGVAARDFNLILNDMIAQNRELWDKTNDITGRGLFSQPGNTMGPMPLPAACAGNFLGFDVTGLNPVCAPGGPGSGNVVGPGSSTDGDFALFSGASGALLKDGPSTVIRNQTQNQMWASPNGSTGAPTWRALVGADLPAPGASSFGGVESLTCSTSNWFRTLSTGGIFGCSQPAFSDISGTIAATQLPNPSATTLGGVKSLAAVAHTYLTSISTAGQPVAAQPVCADLSDSTTYCNSARGQLLGSNTNDSATAGNIGEEIEGVVASGSATSLSTNTPKTVTSISLTAGDWDLSGNCNYNGAGSVSITFVECSLSLVTNTVDQTPGRNSQLSMAAVVPGVAPAFSLPVGPMRFSLASTTIVFLVYNQTFTVGTLTGWGIVRARRMR
jgi:hypothetical protein